MASKYCKTNRTVDVKSGISYTIEQGYGATAGYGTEEEEILTVGLNTVVDVESVQGMLLGNGEVQIDLQ